MYTFVDKVYAHKYHENIATTNSYNSTVTEQSRRFPRCTFG